MSTSLPRIIAHRGASAHAPENSLAAIELAYHEKARWVEVDVKLTGDGVPVLMHDDKVNRTTDGKGPITNYSLEMIQKLDAGGWFAPDFRGETVPSLEQLLDVAERLGLGLNLEIKPNPGEAEATVTACASLLRRRYPNGGAPAILFSTFNRTSLAALHDHAPDHDRGMLASALPRNWLETARTAGCATIHLSNRRVAKKHVDAVKREGFPLLIYTVNDIERARTLLEWGVDSIITDRPGEFIRELGD